MRVGVGFSDNPDSGVAGVEAAREALRQSGQKGPCDLVLLFATARHDAALLRKAVAAELGETALVVGGGAAGAIVNDRFGYAGDQVGLAAIWFSGVTCDVLVEEGLAVSEEATGRRLGEKLAAAGVGPGSPLMLFYDAIDVSSGSLRLLMATHLLRGIEQSLGFLPQINGAGLQGDHQCTPALMWTGQGTSRHCALALSFGGAARIDGAIMHGCRPAAGYYTVTKADNQVILEINNEPALDFLGRLLGPDVPCESYPFFLILGVNRGDMWGEFDEDNYASRLCLGLDRERGGIVMFEPDMVAGTRFQIMYRTFDLDYMRPRIQALFDGLDGRKPVFAMYIDCAGRAAGYGGVEMEDAYVVQEAVAGRVPLLGIYTGVEIAPVQGVPRGLDWTGVFCLFSVPQ